MISYIDATCDLCGEEITSSNKDEEYAHLRNGKIVCRVCGKERPDQVFQWVFVKQAQYDEITEDIGTQPTDEEIEEFKELGLIEGDDPQ